MSAKGIPMKRLLIATALFSGLALAQDVRYNYDQGADFSKYRTYKWVEVPGAGHPDQLVDSQIKAAIDSQLAQKGLTPTTGDNPDLDVGYQVSIDQEKQLDAWGMGGGYRFGGMGQAITSTINIGTLVVDFYDPTARKLVWRGQGTKTLNPSKNPQKNQERLEKSVAKILKNFPPGEK
jgi:hypothetical protein